MSLHGDLLRQAQQLALREPKRPHQASLRRSISASYYGLFHLLIDDAVTLMVTGADRGGLRARRFTREETLDLYGEARQAFADWNTVRRTVQADAFLVALLAYNDMRK